MFGGFAPPQFSKEEIKQLEAEANTTVNRFFATAVLLYICMLSHFARPTQCSVVEGRRKKTIPIFFMPRTDAVLLGPACRHRQNNY
ncbi:Mitochondrial import receptor subunit or translocase [Microdochium nivale]|nr:Mitochondrial import receptor subunit or translocase [Microdochium nivale]